MLADSILSSGDLAHPRAGFNAVPSSRDVYGEALEAGIVDRFHQQGINWFPASDGSNQTVNMGALAAGDHMISTQSRNFPGRNGSRDAMMFIASAQTVAASAVHGRITDPREMLLMDSNELRFEARCWVFGDNVPTDEIVPSALILEPLEVQLAHVLEGLDPAFPREVQDGDIIVAGHHFGQSSGRASAPKALKALGIGCIVAEDFARTFLRNSFDIGLPIAECRGVTGFASTGDRLSVDIPTGTVVNRTTGSTLQTNPPDEFLLQMLRCGGLIPFMEQGPALWEAGG